MAGAPSPEATPEVKTATTKLMPDQVREKWWWFLTALAFAETFASVSELKSDNLPLPILDLLNIQTLAEDIMADPGGRDAKRFAGQIIEDCEEAGELADIRALAQAIRQSSSPEERESLAWQIVALIESFLTPAQTEAAMPALAGVRPSAI